MVVFVILQFINVVLGSLRSLTVAKGSKHVAMLFNVISFTFYAVVVKSIQSQEVWFVVLITALTNLVGYYVADFIFNKMQKDKLWRVSATVIKGKVDSANITDALKKYNIGYNLVDANRAYLIDIFSHTSGESTLIKEILDKYDIQYHVIEISQKL